MLDARSRWFWDIKSDRPDDDAATVEQARKSSNPEAAIKNLQDTNKKPEDASLSNLFKGELEGSKNHLEVSNVQMFFFTLLVVFAYGRAIADRFDNVSESIGTLPELSAGMLALLAISHAGYLANNYVSINPTLAPLVAEPLRRIAPTPNFLTSSLGFIENSSACASVRAGRKEDAPHASKGSQHRREVAEFVVSQ